MYQSMKQHVTVWGQSHEIDVYQQSKSVWVAVGTFKVHGAAPGDFGSQTLRSQGRSAATAARALAEQARYRSN